MLDAAVLAVERPERMLAVRGFASQGHAAASGGSVGVLPLVFSLVESSETVKDTVSIAVISTNGYDTSELTR